MDKELQKSLRDESKQLLAKLKTEAKSHHTLYELRDDAFGEALKLFESFNERLLLLEQAADEATVQSQFAKACYADVSIAN